MVELGANMPITATATDAGTLEGISCTADNTASLGVGKQQLVECTASDASGNDAKCNVAVTVTGALYHAACERFAVSRHHGGDECWCCAFSA